MKHKARERRIDQETEAHRKVGEYHQLKDKRKKIQKGRRKERGWREEREEESVTRGGGGEPGEPASGLILV